MRVIIAAILGGIVMFMWGAVSHMFLGIEASTVKVTPNEAAVVSALKANITEPGFYIMPGLDMRRTPTEEQQAAWMQKYAEGPTAILVYNPTGAAAFTPMQFGVELGSNIFAALLAAIILGLAGVGFVRGFIIAVLIGVIGWASINISYWDWYRFPTNFVIWELIDQVAGWLLSGLVLAFIMRKRG